MSRGACPLGGRNGDHGPPSCEYAFWPTGRGDVAGCRPLRLRLTRGRDEDHPVRVGRHVTAAAEARCGHAGDGAEVAHPRQLDSWARQALQWLSGPGCVRVWPDDRVERTDDEADAP